MAQELISDIVLQSAFDQMERLNKDLETAEKRFISLFDALLKANNELGRGSKTTEDNTDKLKKNKQVLDETEKLKQRIIQLDEKHNAAQSLYAQLLEEQKQALKAANTETANFVKGNNMAAGSLESMEFKLSKLKKEIWSLSDAEGANKSKVEALISEYNKLDTVVRKHQQSMGNFTKTVGNYATGFGGLSASITQLTGEIPNFAISMKTAIMSLSNNIQPLTNAISQLKAQNVALRAEGKPTVSVLGEIGKAFFSWNTAIMLVVAGFTAFGDKIVPFIQNLFDANKQMKMLNDAMLTGAKNATTEVNELDRLYKKTQDVNLSHEERLAAVDKMQRIAPAYFSTIKDETFLTGGAAVAYGQLRNAILAVAQAKAIQDKLTEISNDGLEKEADLIKKLQKAKLDEAQNRGRGFSTQQPTGTAGIYTTTNYSPEEGDAYRTQLVKNAENELLIYRITQQEKKKIYIDMLNDLDNVTLKHEEKMASYNTNGGNNNANGGNNNAKNKRNKDLKEELYEYQSTLEWHDNEVLTMQEKADADLYEKMQKNLEKRNKKRKEADKEMLDLIKQNLDAIETMQDDNAEKEKEIADGRKRLLQGYHDLSDAVYNAAEQRIRTRTELELDAISRTEKAELDKLDKLTLTEEEKAERKKQIEIDADARREKAHRQEITRLRRLAIFERTLASAEILYNTAKAISAHSKLTPPANYIQMAADAVIGAAQLAKINGAPLPQYAEGTEKKGGHKGGFAIVGEKGTELGILPDGKTFLTPDTATIMNMPARTIIKPNHELEDIIIKSALSKLANIPTPITTDSMQKAMLDAFSELTSEVKDLKRVTKEKELIAKFYGDYGHINHVKNSML